MIFRTGFLKSHVGPTTSSDIDDADRQRTTSWSVPMTREDYDAAIAAEIPDDPLEAEFRKLEAQVALRKCHNGEHAAEMRVHFGYVEAICTVCGLDLTPTYTQRR